MVWGESVAADSEAVKGLSCGQAFVGGFSALTW
jgi:hypothetical protein